MTFESFAEGVKGLVEENRELKIENEKLREECISLWCDLSFYMEQYKALSHIVHNKK